MAQLTLQSLWKRCLPEKAVSSLSNSNYFTLAKNADTKVVLSISCQQKLNSCQQFLKNCIPPNIQLNGVVNRLLPFKDLFDHTNTDLSLKKTQHMWLPNTKYNILLPWHVILNGYSKKPWCYHMWWTWNWILLRK